MDFDPLLLSRLQFAFVRPGNVLDGGRVIGADPDPFIRDQLLRECNSGRPN
jgi:hypothetical protein